MECKATLKNNVLVLENSRIRRVFGWNNGNVVSRLLEDKKAKARWTFKALCPDVSFPGESPDAGPGALETTWFEGDAISSAHLRAEVAFSLGALKIRRLFRIYPGVPAIACDYFLKGKVTGTWQGGEIIRNSVPIEKIELLMKQSVPAPVLDRLCLSGAVNFEVKAVQFFDVTDHNNTFVAEHRMLPYVMPAGLKGNLLLCRDTLKDRGFFVLKEAPCSDMQLEYPGFDFLVGAGNFLVAGAGVSPADLREKEWTRCYSCVVGTGPDSEDALLANLRAYQGKLRRYLPDRDRMVMLNTWGDRGQDRSIGEAFALKEIEAGARLGVTHFQLDDGWQKGRTVNSAAAGGTLNCIWDRNDFWDVHPERFPHGLKPVKIAASAAGVELCLWFNPCTDNSYAHWEKDADRLISLYREFGIRIFKIDGVMIPDKRAEEHLRALFDKVMAATDQQAVFNLDVTAGRRFGYHYFYEYGNKFLENRYTDWGNYYPHFTLRNLWMLSRYLPPQSLQIEFLNKWRNAQKYDPKDPLAPRKAGFDYCFAITMMAQPLAWFEASNLPQEAFRIAPLIRIYKEHQAAIHQGRIFPVGQEPSGFSWTGFQSVHDKGGYVLVFREYNKRPAAGIRLWQAAMKRIRFKCIIGKGKNFVARADKEGEIQFKLPSAHSFCLYQYKV